MSDNSVIVLIGYMGCGKSSVGKKLSQKLNVKFVDLDSVIEKKYSKSESSSGHSCEGLYFGLE